MKRPSQVLSGRRMKMQNHKVVHEQREPTLRSSEDSNRHLLFRHLNFVAKSQNARREPSALACETGLPQVKMLRTGHIGKRGTADGVKRQMNPEFGLQVYLTHFSITSPSLASLKVF